MTGLVPVPAGRNKRANGCNEERSACQKQHDGALNRGLGEIEAPHLDRHVGTDHANERSDDTNVHGVLVKRWLERGNQPRQQEGTTDPSRNERCFGYHASLDVWCALGVAVESDENAENGCDEGKIAHGSCW